MGKVLTHSYGQENGILKHFPYLGAAVLVPATMGVAQTDGRKLVVAGTPFPKNDGTCKGILLHTVDVTLGDATGTIVYQGDIDTAKLTANGITVADTAKEAIPRVTFWS